MKVGIIGCGAIARRTHLPAYKALNADIIAIADLNEAKAKLLAKKFNIKKQFTNYKDLLNEDLDLISICTPNATHAPIAIDAAKSGKHVLVEKPMATSLQEADEMIRVCKDSGVKLCIMHNYRLIPCVLEAKKRIAAGRIGSIISIHMIGRQLAPLAWTHSSWFYHKWGLLEDFGYHLIDIINFICNSPVKEVKVVARDYTSNMECLNHINTMMLLTNNACVNMDLSWIGSLEITLKILGTAGTLNIDIKNNHLREIHGYLTPIEDLASSWKEFWKTIKTVLDKTYFKDFMYHHQLIIKQFIESITNGTEPPILGEEGRAVMEIIDLIKNEIENPKIFTGT